MFIYSPLHDDSLIIKKSLEASCPSVFGMFDELMAHLIVAPLAGTHGVLGATPVL